MNGLDAVELDVAGGRRSADEGQQAVGPSSSSACGACRRRLVGAHHARLAVGNEVQGAASLSGARVEDQVAPASRTMPTQALDARPPSRAPCVLVTRVG
jgi:hypothetical protein